MKLRENIKIVVEGIKKIEGKYSLPQNSTRGFHFQILKPCRETVMLLANEQ